MKTGIKIFLAFLLIAALLIGAVDMWIPDAVSVYTDATCEYANCLGIMRNSDIKATLGYIPLKKLTLNQLKNTEVIVGGVPFGVKLYTDGLLVVGFSEINTGSGEASPAKKAGIKSRDIIKSVNGKTVTTIDEFTATVEASGGAEIEITYCRKHKEYSVKVKPELAEQDGKYKLGMWLKDSTSGIGTVTFAIAESGEFAGLGHGICDSDTGELMPLGNGIVTDVAISGIVKGKIGTPGELKGYFTTAEVGKLICNTNCGVVGKYAKAGHILSKCKDKMKIGLRSDVKDGKATVRCTLDDDGVKEYEIAISAINTDGTDNKNFMITVTDPELLEKTGGIVQGMSGSPIIQNGKLVGAVTHVLINDPTRGYGIFIENMLAACG